MRRWRPADREPFAAMNADPQLMAHFPAVLDRGASDAFVDRIEAGFEVDGFGLWALERIDTGEFIGFTGLSVARFRAHFTPAVEVGWRLSRRAWGQGLATEAGRQALRVGFEQFGLPEIVSFTASGNAASRAVMRRLGMRHDPDEDFEHPALPPGHPLRNHVLYRLSRAGFDTGTGSRHGQRHDPAQSPSMAGPSMAAESRHLGIRIDRPAAEVYDYVSQPANLPRWAAGLGSSIELIDGQWVAESPLGRIVVAMVEQNPYGVLDHWVTLATGERFYNPMRVIADGDGCELVFTLRRQPGVSETDFERDAAAVAADLAAVRRLLESR